MRNLEIALAVLVACGYLIMLRPRSRRGHWLTVITMASFFVLAAHVVTEGYRWQMLPVYALFVGMAIIAAVRRPGTTWSISGRFVRILVAGAGVLAIACTTAVAALLPVPQIPEPSGPYPVGTMTFRFVDESREEHYTPDADDKREIMVQVWYPAAEARGDKAQWIDRPDVMGPAIAENFGFPSFVFDHIGLIETNATVDAPMADGGGPFPVVLYSHGWTGFRSVNTDQVEALASHGYVVISPDHTYGAMVTVFPDGRIAPNYPDAIPDRKAVGDEVYFAAVQRLVDSFAGDLRYMLDQAEQWNRGDDASPFADKLDMTRVGVFGHSTGGGAAVELCATDHRVKAGLGMDVWALPISDDLLDKPKELPFLMMDSEVWSSDENSARQSRLWESLQGPAYRMVIKGTRHNDFTLMPLASPMAPYIGLKGPLEGRRVVQIVDTYLIAFFDQFLRGEDSALLKAGSEEFPEVALKTKASGESGIDSD